VDPRNLRPVSHDRQSQEQARKAEEQRLEKMAGDLSLVLSAEGQRVIELIKEQLEKRLSRLAEQDEQAQSLIGLLAEMGVKYYHARRATEKLAQRYLAAAANDQ
jgi:hypothetical protein